MTTFGINFPFMDSDKGDFVRMTQTPDQEIRSNLIHLILTRRGSRYYMPDFGTRLYEFIFNPNDSVTYSLIEEEITEGVKKYIPNLQINKITITPATESEETSSVSEMEDERLFRVSDASTKEYTAKVKIDYTSNSGAFATSDFIIINI